jgi:surfactin synthase thioesterase subunit
VHDMAAWRNHASRDFQLRIFPGGHFFFEPAMDELAQSVVVEAREWGVSSSGSKSSNSE